MEEQQVGPTLTRRRYTDDERSAATALAEREGVVAAARELDIPQSNVSKWCATARMASVADPGVAQVVAPVVVITSGAVPPRTPRSSPPPAAGPKPPRPGVAKSWTPSQRAEILEYAAASAVTATSTRFGASRFSIYEWGRRVKLAVAGKGASPTSGPAPADIEAQGTRRFSASGTTSRASGRARS